MLAAVFGQRSRQTQLSTARFDVALLRSWRFIFARSTIANVRLRSGEGRCLPGATSKILSSRGAGREYVLPWMPPETTALTFGSQMR
jgi:hypothetical protein